MPVGSAGFRDAALAAMAATGAGLYAYGLTFPVYTNAAAAARLKADACPGVIVREGWFEDLAALETLRHPLMQSGVSLILAAATLFALYRIFGTGGWQLRSPATKRSFFGLGIMVLGIGWAAQIYGIDLDHGRGDYPWCADSIMIGMVSMTIFFALLTVICLTVGAALTMAFRAVPTPLFAWPSQTSGTRRWVITVPAAAFAGLIAFLGIDNAMLSSTLGTPAAILALYLTESTRSAMVAPPPDAA